MKQLRIEGEWMALRLHQVLAPKVRFDVAFHSTFGREPVVD